MNCNVLKRVEKRKKSVENGGKKTLGVGIPKHIVFTGWRYLFVIFFLISKTQHFVPINSHMTTIHLYMSRV